MCAYIVNYVAQPPGLRIDDRCAYSQLSAPDPVRASAGGHVLVWATGCLKIYLEIAVLYALPVGSSSRVQDAGSDAESDVGSNAGSAGSARAILEGGWRAMAGQYRGVTTVAALPVVRV
jgi:hypothetical protein